MFISNSKNFIFFHIPKSGGTSVTRMLSSEASWNDLALGGTSAGEAIQIHWKRGFGIGKHTSPIELQNLADPDNFSKYQKFIVVRNPAARLTSSFKFIKLIRETKPNWLINSGECDKLGTWTTATEFIASNYFQNAINKRIEDATDIEKFILPQSLYLALEAPETSPICFRLEDLARSTRPLVDAGFLKVEADLPIANKTESQLVSIPDELNHAAVNLYRQDYVAFGYNA